MGSFFQATASYLLDGLRVWPLPVTTFSRAAERELPAGQIAGLVLLFAVAVCLAEWFYLVAFVQQGEPLSGWFVIARFVLVCAYFMLGAGLLFASTRLFGGQASFRRLLCAYLVFLSISLVAWLVAAGAAFTLRALDAAAMIDPVWMIGSLALTLILAAYAVLAARFGGMLGFPAAIGAALVYLASSVALDMAYRRLVFGEEISLIDYFGLMLSGSPL